MNYVRIRVHDELDTYISMGPMSHCCESQNLFIVFFSVFFVLFLCNYISNLETQFFGAMKTTLQDGRVRRCALCFFEESPEIEKNTTNQR